MHYDAGSLNNEFGARFRLVEGSKEIHQMLFGTTLQFRYRYGRAE
jgi:hypothetical protein